MLDASWVSPSFYSRPAHSVTESRSRRRTRLGHQLSRHHQRYVQAVVRKRVLQEKAGAQDRGVSAQRRVRKVTMLEVTTHITSTLKRGLGSTRCSTPSRPAWCTAASVQHPAEHHIAVARLRHLSPESSVG